MIKYLVIYQQRIIPDQSPFSFFIQCTFSLYVDWLVDTSIERERERKENRL